MPSSSRHPTPPDPLLPAVPVPSVASPFHRRGFFLFLGLVLAGSVGLPAGGLEGQAPGATGASALEGPALPSVPGFPAPPLASSPLAGQGVIPGTRIREVAPLSLSRSLEDAMPVTPRGAFLRSLAIPGWGHLAADSPTRAAFYVAAQGGAGWMLGRSMLRQRNARRFRSAEFDLVREELRAQGIQNPDSLRFQAEADPRVTRWDDLVEIRGDQVEDWLALSIFLTLLGATDALVAAHLADFPEALTFTASPGPRAGSVEMGLRLPWPRRGGAHPRH